MKLLTFALIILSAASCNYDGKINGRKYKLEKQCLESWTRIEPRMVGKTMFMIPHKHCKTYGRIDTIWQ